MKKTLLILICISIHQLVPAQVQWTKYANNPVMTKGASSWEAIAIGQPTCLIENDTIKMWYVAVDGTLKARISYAWSLDGITWTKYNSATPVLDVGVAGEWDRGWLDAPEIVRDASGYKLYYYGDTTQQGPEISSACGAASSPDGINWTRYINNPVLTKGDSIDFDGKWMESPAVIYNADDSSYLLWYTGVAWDWLIKNGLASSSDGYSWTKYAGNPVTDVGMSGSFDDMWVAVPAVIKSGSIYEMWYCGFSSLFGFDSVRIGYVVSTNGIDWLKYPGNPIYSRTFAPFDTLNDKDGPWAPDVIFNEQTGEYMMWYEGTSGLQMASSPRNVLYSINCNVSVSNDTTINTGDSVQLSATGGTLYHWSPGTGLNDPNNATVWAKPITTTEYTVLIVGDSCIITDTVTVTVLPLGINTIAQGIGQMRIYPNPFQDFTTIEIENFNNENYTLNIYNYMGQLVSSINNTKSGKIRIEKRNLTSGLYFLELKNNQRIMEIGKMMIE